MAQRSDVDSTAQENEGEDEDTQKLGTDAISI